MQFKYSQVEHRPPKILTILQPPSNCNAPMYKISVKSGIHASNPNLLPRSKSSAIAETAVQNCVCHFLLANNTNIHPILHHVQVIAQYWVGVLKPFFKNKTGNRFVETSYQ